MIIYLLGLILSFAAGAWFVIAAPTKRSWIYLFLSAGGAYLMAIIFTHILPELFEELPERAGYVLLIGFLVQIFLENYSKGIEHGHSHATTSRKALWIAFAALCMHALIEGMPMASVLSAPYSEFNQQLTIGIMLHKIPVAITLATLLVKSGMSRNSSLVLLALFISCTLLGSGLQWVIGDQAGADATELMFMSLGLTIGILLHVSTTILFESSDHHRLSPSRVVVIILGIALALLS